MELRQATVEEAAAIVELHARTVREVNGRSYSEAEIEAWLAHSSLERTRERIALGGVLVAVGSCGAIVGFADRSGDRIAALYVAADHQGEGIGSRLLEQLEEDARREGVRTLTAHSTTTAVGFYQRRGYEVGPPVDCPVTRDIPLAACLVSKALPSS
jgi:putative acetyltransferase